MSNENAQTTSKYAALLADQSFNFAPYFDDAVCKWLASNLSTLLKEQPNACKYFVRDENHYRDAAAAIPLTEEFRKYVLDLVKFMETRNDVWGFNQLASRLSTGDNASTVDQIYDMSPKLCRNNGEMIGALSQPKFEEYLRTVSPNTLELDDSYLLGFFKRVPKDKFKKWVVSIEKYSHYWNKRSRCRIVSAIAQTIPFEDMGLLVPWLNEKYGKEFLCFSCGEKEAKSRPGYSLHRNTVCDKENKYPNLTEIMGRRLHKEGQAPK